jgi:hypothetical protein
LAEKFAWKSSVDGGAVTTRLAAKDYHVDKIAPGNIRRGGSLPSMIKSKRWASTATPTTVNDL